MEREKLKKFSSKINKVENQIIEESLINHIKEEDDSKENLKEKSGNFMTNNDQSVFSRLNKYKEIHEKSKLTTGFAYSELAQINNNNLSSIKEEVNKKPEYSQNQNNTKKESEKSKSSKLERAESIKNRDKLKSVQSEVESCKSSNYNSDNANALQRKNSIVKNREKINISYGLGNKHLQSKLQDNRISTTKYNISTFLPLSLLLQFRRAANIYFLIVSIMTCFEFSPKKPSSMIGTFTFVLIATMIKEFIEDYSRYTQDKASNERKTLVLESDGWKQIECSLLRPGNIVKIIKEEEFSADCVIIQSSNNTGFCYIDTKNLDGESNLKEKTSVEQFKLYDDFHLLTGNLKCDQTNENLHQFEGIISIDGQDENKPNEVKRMSMLTNSIFINMRNMILKGCTLKNTAWTVGIVVYTGKNTKIMRNSKNPAVKVSNILKIMNVLLYSLFAFTLAICIFLAGLSLDFKYRNQEKLPYIFNVNVETLSSQSDVLYYFIRVIIFFVAYSNIIPISLYVALEFVKIFQGILIFFDSEIYDNFLQKPAKCRATDLIEELGQVEFIFSDKTGTLTQNIMILKKCYIDGELYGLKKTDVNLNEASNYLIKFKGSKLETPVNNLGNYSSSVSNKKIFKDVHFAKGINEVCSEEKLKTNSEAKLAIENKVKNFLKTKSAKSVEFDFNLEKLDNNSSVKKEVNQIKSNPNLINSNKHNNFFQSQPQSSKLNHLPISNEFLAYFKNKSKNGKFTINGDADAFNLMTNPTTSIKAKQKIDDYFNILSLCHSVFPEKNEFEEINYQGASPDDIALVHGANQFGYTFESKSFTILNIYNEIFNIRKSFELLVEMPFDSDRKRMSVIVKDLETDKIKLYSKGADTIMMNRIDWKATVRQSLDEKMAENENLHVNEEWEKLKLEEIKYTNEILDTLCKEGLRCLVLGQKEISSREFDAWFIRYQNAKEKGRDVSKYFDEIERNIYFAGITAIEDKLQDGVDNTISSLMSCGIRVWVLTGDKEDTALEIGKSCKLITDENSIIKLTNFEEIESMLIGMVRKFSLATNGFLGEDFFENYSKESIEESNETTNFFLKLPEFDLEKVKEHIHSHYNHSSISSALIVDGSCLEFILNSQCLSSAFFLIASSCKSVICCRVSPKQKSKVVKLAKNHGSWITLSIGDGANDVPMIMEAHIGVGIQGREGTQAVRSSDFSIGQFRFLEKLLLDYGRNSYFKISNFICYYFYKNILLAFTEFYFSLYNGFSGQIFFADYLNTMYNAFFTSWPCLFTFFYEKTHSAEINRNFPILYKAGQINHYFNLKVFWTYIGYSILHSAFCFFIPFYSLYGVVDNSLPYKYDLWMVSTISFSMVIHVATYKLLNISYFWNELTIVAIITSLIFYYVVLFVISNNVFSLMFQPEIIAVPYYLSLTPTVIFLVFLAPVLILLPDIILKQISFNLNPNPAEYLLIHNKLISNKIKSDGELKTETNVVHERLSLIITQRKKTLYGRRMGSTFNVNNAINNIEKNEEDTKNSPNNTIFNSKLKLSLLGNNTKNQRKSAFIIPKAFILQEENSQSSSLSENSSSNKSQKSLKEDSENKLNKVIKKERNSSIKTSRSKSSGRRSFNSNSKGRRSFSYATEEFQNPNKKKRLSKTPMKTNIGAKHLDFLSNQKDIFGLILENNNQIIKNPFFIEEEPQIKRSPNDYKDEIKLKKNKASNISPQTNITNNNSNTNNYFNIINVNITSGNLEKNPNGDPNIFKFEFDEMQKMNQALFHSAIYNKNEKTGMENNSNTSSTKDKYNKIKKNFNENNLQYFNSSNESNQEKTSRTLINEKEEVKSPLKHKENRSYSQLKPEQINDNKTKETRKKKKSKRESTSNKNKRFSEVIQNKIKAIEIKIYDNEAKELAKLNNSKHIEQINQIAEDNEPNASSFNDYDGNALKSLKQSHSEKKDNGSNHENEFN